MFIALDIHHAIRTRHIVICALPRLYNTFPHYLKRHDFRKKKSYRTQNVCFDFPYNFFFISYSKKNQARYQNYIFFFMYGTRYSCQISTNLNFLDRFSEKKHQISWKSVQWRPSCSVRDGQTDMTKLVVAFRIFANAPKISCENLIATLNTETIFPNIFSRRRNHIGNWQSAGA